MDESLNNLCSGQQNGIGVWPGSEDPVTVVEVIVERRRDLVRAAAVVILVFILHWLGGSPVLFMQRRVSFPEVAEVWLSGPNAVVLLDLQGNQG